MSLNCHGTTLQCCAGRKRPKSLPYVVTIQVKNPLHSGIHAIKDSVQVTSWNGLPNLFQLFFQLFRILAFVMLVQLPVHPSPGFLYWGQIRGVCWPGQKMTGWHMVSNEGHVGGCLVGWSIVLLQFPVVSPLASMCKHLVALWNEVVTEHISVLTFCHSLVRELGFGIDVFADLFVSLCHKLETCGAMIAAAHVHMSSNAMLRSGNSAPCCWCTPPASWFATSMQSEVLAVGDHDPAP